jgi:cytochrome c oxidase cbb3-type subunit 3
VIRAVLILLVGGMAFAADEPGKKVKLPTGRSDLANGQKLFDSQCALCHGTGGGGGRGPALAHPKLKRAPDDAALVNVIQDGIRGSEMPGAWQMNEREIHQVAAYVRSLGRVSSKPVAGDILKGSQLYQSKGGCASCHMIKGQGGVMGPNLTEIGLRRSPTYLREAIENPEAALPEGFLQIRVAPNDGPAVTGVRLTEDSFTIQLRDYAGRLYSYWKRDLKEVLKDRGKSPMPSYKDKFTDAEMNDLVAYLASLRED